MSTTVTKIVTLKIDFTCESCGRANIYDARFTSDREDQDHGQHNYFEAQVIYAPAGTNVQESWPEQFSHKCSNPHCRSTIDLGEFLPEFVKYDIRKFALASTK